MKHGAQWDAVTSSATKKAPAADLEGGSLPPDAKQYWAFQMPVRRPIPVTANERMSRHPVDAFVMQKLQERGLTPAPRADAITLVRRAYLDLIGLPPTPAEVAEFVNDSRADAWEKLIDRLLASPHYGERWGRHWLDVARYADSNGFEHDFDRPNAWRYRDYVIQAFNQDKPYNVFLREQIAGDELDWVTNDSLIATGFLRNYAKVGFREKDNPEFRYEYLDDMIAHDRARHPRADRPVRAMPQSQVRSDPAEGLLQAAGLAVRLRRDGSSADDARRSGDATKRRLAEIDARGRTPLRQKIRRSKSRIARRLLAGEVQEIPGECAARPSRLPKRSARPGKRCSRTGDSHRRRLPSAEIDRLMKPEDLAQKKELAAAVAAIEKERPAPIPMAMGITDGDYRFTPDGPGDEPAPGKGIKQRGDGGQLPAQRPGTL